MTNPNEPQSAQKYSHKIRVAAVGDIHVTREDKGKWVPYFQSVAHHADVLLLCGDLTDTGDEKEAEILSEELRACAIPVICVLGNHDYEKGRHREIRKILHHEPVHVLDGEAVVIHGVGFAGVKGFGGGFDRHMLSMFGEAGMKHFVQEAIDEANRLDRALSRLDHEHGPLKKIAVLHYSPVKETLHGEPAEILPFLGSSRLLEPILRRDVIASFHGHAHAGTLEADVRGAKVYNVALPVLRRAGYPQGFYVYEVDISDVPQEILAQEHVHVGHGPVPSAGAPISASSAPQPQAYARAPDVSASEAPPSPS